MYNDLRLLLDEVMFIDEKGSNIKWCSCLLMQAMNVAFLYAWHVCDSVQITLPTEILSSEMNILKHSVFSDFNTYRKQITQ